MKSLIKYLKEHLFPHRNKFKKGDRVIWNDFTFVVCDFVNDADTTKYIIIDDTIHKDIYEWIDEKELRKVW